MLLLALPACLPSFALASAPQDGRGAERAAPPAVLADPDSDGDGLSDFREAHKHFTDPRRADSDGDGVPDGDWNERREYAYTVRAVMHVMAPFDVASMTDDHQDVRVFDARADLLEFEVVIYPFNTVASALAGARGWRTPDPALQPFLAPGVCGNWDEPMRSELLAGLRADGIDLDALDDAQAARAVSKWLLERTAPEDSFTTFAVEFPGGQPAVVPSQAASVDATLRRFGRTLEQQWDRELLGAGMFRTRLRGSCTSSAIYLSTGLRAAGIPARTIVCVPLVDASDAREVGWLPRLAHRGVRRIVQAAAEAQRGSWTSHTFNEVFVGGRWRRLNYAHLGQAVLDREFLGLMVHVHTFGDHSEAGLAAWGERMLHPQHAALFGGPNPYSCIALSDAFGAHAPIDAEATRTLQELTIGRVYWYDDPKKHPGVTLRLDDAATAGHLLAHVEDELAADSADLVREFYADVDKRFVLRAAGAPDVPVAAARGYWLDAAHGVREFYLRIEPADLAALRRGVVYELAWRGTSAVRFGVRPGTTLVR